MILRKVKKVLKNLKWTSTSAPVDILVVDLGAVYINRCLPQDVTYRAIPIRGECWYFNTAIALELLNAIVHKKKYNMGLRGCYVAAVAKSLKVSTVLTYIDNNNWDFGLSNYLGRGLVCVQNATRPRWYVNKLNKCFDCYLVYSPELADPAHGLRIFSREAHTVGHLKLGIFYQGLTKGEFSQLILDHRSLVWISTYREPEDYEDEIKEKREEYIRIMQLGVNHMSRYAAENGFQARVALSSHKKNRSPSREVACLSENVDHDLAFSLDDGKEREWISYKEVWAAELVLGINSTLLFESAALGKRTVLFLPTEDRRNALEQIAPISIMQPLIVTGSSYEEFAKKCDQILDMPDKKYNEIVTKIRQEVCFLDPNDLPQERIKRKLHELVKQHSRLG